MRYNEWETLYEEILKDMGYDRSSDESSARLLKAIMLNSDLISDDEIIMDKKAAVFGNGPNLEEDIQQSQPTGTLIASGSAVGRLMETGITPDIIVTDLDGEIGPQIECNNSGSVAFIHAHGDNSELIQKYAQSFKGPVILTTQSRPDSVLSDYGGFTDGDRAVCIAEHFGAKEIFLYGFDFDRPSPKDNSDLSVKSKKLQWAKKIIFEHSDPDVRIVARP